MYKVVLGLITVISFTSCTSLVYSPSVNLTNKPLKEKEVDLQGGVELLPETRPDFIDSYTTYGYIGQISYGFSDNFTMSAKTWGDLSDEAGSFRQGYSFSAQFISSFNESSRLIIIPRAGFAMYGNTIFGFGYSASLIYQNEINEEFAWYAGGGPIFGYEDLYKRDFNIEEKRLPMGYGFIANFGFGWQFTKNIRMNFELSPLYQRSIYDKESHFLVAPTIAFGYTFKL